MKNINKNILYFILYFTYNSFKFGRFPICEGITSI